MHQQLSVVQFDIRCIQKQNQFILMNQNRNRKGRGAQIPMFISKLLEILQNHSLYDIVSWTTTSDSFNIKDISRFTDEVLPAYFKHRNFASFIRQLNMYGFKKTRHCDGENVYMNEYFRQGAKHLLKNIIRKVREEKEEALAIPNQSLSVTDGSKVSRDIQQLKIKQRSLEQMCKHFLLQNQRLLEENNNLVIKMENDSREKERRLEEFLLQILAQKNARAIKGSYLGPILSITNDEYHGTQENHGHQIDMSNATPLELIGQAFDKDPNIKKMREIIENDSKSSKNLRKRNKNYTIIPFHQDQRQKIEPNPVQPLFNHFQNEISQISVPPLHQSNEDKSFLSINDFLNAQDQGIDLECPIENA